MGSPVRSPAPIRDRELKDALIESESDSLQGIFDNNLQFMGDKGYVSEGTNCRSLGAIGVAPRNFTFHESVWDGKRRLRSRINDGLVTLDLSITSVSLRDEYEKFGLERLQDRFSRVGRLHLRIGLARAFPGQPGKCFVQLNGAEVL
jgi:hypothetical protein